MLRTIAGVAAGIVGWFLLVSLMDRGLRIAWPDYAAVYGTMTFDLPMKLARLTESTVALVFAAYVTARIAPSSRAAPWALGIVLLVFFIPVHYTLWSKFPIWYHAYFLTSLVAISVIVGMLVGKKRIPGQTEAL